MVPKGAVIIELRNAGTLKNHYYPAILDVDGLIMFDKDAPIVHNRDEAIWLVNVRNVQSPQTVRDYESKGTPRKTAGR
jgi:hypothetical protein